ncbi:NTPase [Brasilonema sp. UFV-L1]|nr:HEAT repeat domain-containing protein [Brasilonema sp. UFV-L1]NMG11343.1 NTPase [Brasilonema sp. UFV-L1]
MLKWLVDWVATNSVGLVVKIILNEEFAKDLANNYAKDFFKYDFNNVVTALAEKEQLQKAIAKALKEFLQLVEEELKFCRLSDEEIQKFAQPLKIFIYDKSVKEVLSQAFDAHCDSLDDQTLEKTWQILKLPSIPAKFNWQLVSDSYLRKAQQILFESYELRNILISQTLHVENKDKQTREVLNFYLTQYQESIRDRYTNLKLENLETSSYVHKKFSLWRMFIPQNVREVHHILPQIYELPKKHLQRLRENNQLEAEEPVQEELERHKQDYLKQPVRSVIDIIQDTVEDTYPTSYPLRNKGNGKSKIVILGNPGSGKSTLLQYLALDWVEKILEDKDFHLKIPLLIELRTYIQQRKEKEYKNFLDFFHEYSGAIAHFDQSKLQEQLKAGNALVMLDGLDEVFELEQREDIINNIQSFTNEYPDVQVIVTSRVIGYKPQQLRDADFRHFMLQDFEPEQIQDFINRWYCHSLTENLDGENKKQRLQKAIDTSQAIAELAGNPLLLTMMAVLNHNQELPQNRDEFYNQASRVLLNQWNVQSTLVEDEVLDSKTIDVKDKQAILRRVAYHMQTSEKGSAGNLISAKDLESILTEYLKTIEVEKATVIATGMISQLQTHNFLCFLGADYYGFVHRTFLEYFCAWEFVWQLKETQTLKMEELKTEVFGKYWGDETWHEILRMIAGMIEQTNVREIIEDLIGQNGESEKFSNLFLAAKCLDDLKNRTVTKTAQKLLSRFKELTKNDSNNNDNSSFDFLEKMLIQEIHTQAIALVTTTWKDEPNTLNFLKYFATTDENWNIPDTAIQEFAKEFKQNPDTIDFLKHRATSDDSESVRRAAIQELAKEFKNKPDTLDFLKHCATTDESWNVRRVAIQELAKEFKNKPDTLDFLKHCATTDKSWNVRRVAIQELAKEFKNKPDTLDFLKHCATTDENWNVQTVAIQELAKGFKENPESLNFLKHCATSDDSEFVRSAAIQELAKEFKDEPGIFEIFYNCAVSDFSEHGKNHQPHPRQVALEIIIKQYSNHPQTLPLLRDRAENDLDKQVRKFAQKKLAELENSIFIKYTIVIQWSQEDQCYVVFLPELTDVMQPCTHGETHEQALKNAQEVLKTRIHAHKPDFYQKLSVSQPNTNKETGFLADNA